MSEQDRFDWNEDTNFESEADVKEDYGDFEDPLDGFTDYEDMSGYEDLSEDGAPAGEALDGAKPVTGEVVREVLAEKIPADKKTAAALQRRKRRQGISTVKLGFLFTISILVAGVGVGGAILVAEGGSPASLWQPQNLLQIDQLLNFADHPLNVLYMVTMGIVFLAMLGSYKMSRAAVEANERTWEAESMLDSLTALNLDKQKDWQSQEFKKFPPAEAFVTRTLGAWRLQESRQNRLMGVEGELHRLEKALDNNSREDLTGRFDHPAVGRLADEMIRYFDARETAVLDLEKNESKNQENSTESIDNLQESRRWNGSTLDHLGVQCAAMDELSGQMGDFAKQVENAMAEPKSTEDMTNIIESIRKDIAKQSSGGTADGQTVPELNDLVDRGSKLAFKIAMEVARLGPRGERLLPMSQDLENLSTGFRQLIDSMSDRDGGKASTRAQSSIHKKLETLAALITQDDQAPWRDMADKVQGFGPSAALISGKLTRMIDGFNEQEDRLVRLGRTFADLTGADFDSSSIPREESSDAPVASVDSIDQEPAASSEEPTVATATVDPDAAPEAPGLELDVPTKFNLNSESPPDMSLSEDEEKVYDLEDFGADPVAEPETEDTDEVFELSDLGATPMDQAVESDLDGSSVEDEVFELSDFGATPMDQAVESDNDGASVEDEVFELSDFGAKPMS